MSQSRAHSLIEATTGTAIGYVIAVITQTIVYPLFGMVVSLSQNFAIAGVFTVISIIRSYWVRRLFNKLGLRRPPQLPIPPLPSRPPTGERGFS